MSFNSPLPDILSSQLINRAIVALSVAAFGSGMSMRVMDPMLVRLASDFAIPIGMASWSVTVFGLAYGFSQLLFGPLGDRYGKVKVVAFGSVACSLAALFCASAQDFSWLLIGRVLGGATAASIIPLAMAWIGDVVAYENRQAVLAKFLIGQILGLSAGVLVGGFCADFLNWRIPFFIIATWFALIGLYLGLHSKRLPDHTHVVQLGEGSGIARLLSEFQKVLAIPWARQVLLTVGLEGAAVFGALAFVPAHLHTTHDLSLSSSGALVTLFGLGGLTFAFQSRRWIGVFGEVRLIQAGALIMCVSLISLGWVPLWWLTMPACFLFGLGFYMMHNTLQINATQMAPERRGAAVATFASCFFLGQSSGVTISGATLTTVGTPLLLTFSGLLVFIVGLRFAILRKQQSLLS
jgi:predicted MFS family arabinose efflux permease